MGGVEIGTVAIEGVEIGRDPVPEVAVAWHRPTTDPHGPAVLLTHGAGGNLDDRGLVALATVLAAGGHLVVRCNLPYRQRRASGPPPRAERGVGDLAAIVAAITGEGADDVDGRPWVVGGKSYGGRLATMLAAGVDGVDRVVARDRVPVPVGVLCYSYPLHPQGRPDRVRVDHWPAVDVPVLFLQGTSDPFGGPEELAPHLPLLAAGATVVAVEGGDHSLKVPRTRSHDGATHGAAEVVAGRAGDCATWLATLGRPAM